MPSTKKSVESLEKELEKLVKQKIGLDLRYGNPHQLDVLKGTVKDEGHKRYVDLCTKINELEKEIASKRHDGGRNKVHTGPRGGKYVVVAGKKRYI